MSDYKTQVVIGGRKIETLQDILSLENKLKILFVEGKDGFVNRKIIGNERFRT